MKARLDDENKQIQGARDPWPLPAQQIAARERIMHAAAAEILISCRRGQCHVSC